MGISHTLVHGGKYYNVDWANGELVLSEQQHNGELYIDIGKSSNFFLVEGSSWSDLHISELPDVQQEFDFPEGNSPEIFCSCGTEKVGGVVHSSWCDVGELVSE